MGRISPRCHNGFRVGDSLYVGEDLDRYGSYRSTGGLGTGVYYFRNMKGAVNNIDFVSGQKPMMILDKIRCNGHVFEPRDEQAAQNTNLFGRELQNLAEYLMRDANRDYRIEEGDTRFKRLHTLFVLAGLYHVTKELDAKVIHKAAVKSRNCMERTKYGKGCKQPINHFLRHYGITGVCPKGKAGNTGDLGCVTYLNPKGITFTKKLKKNG
jgi:hypothetical protein